MGFILFGNVALSRPLKCHCEINRFPSKSSTDLVFPLQLLILSRVLFGAKLQLDRLELNDTSFQRGMCYHLEQERLIW